MEYRRNSSVAELQHSRRQKVASALYHRRRRPGWVYSTNSRAPPGAELTRANVTTERRARSIGGGFECSSRDLRAGRSAWAAALF